MSWDVLVFKINGELPILEDLPGDFRFPNIGTISEVQNLISNVFKTTDWNDKTWGISQDKEFSIEFAIGSDEFVEQITLFIRGSGEKAILDITKLCKNLQWTAFDISAGEYIDLENPYNASWTAFQEYRNKVIEKFNDLKPN